MELFKYRPWNGYTEDVIVKNRIFFPSKEKLNDPAELVHPIEFEENLWSSSVQNADKAIENFTRTLFFDISYRFYCLEVTARSYPEILESPEYRPYRDISDSFLRKLEAFVIGRS